MNWLAKRKNFLLYLLAMITSSFTNTLASAFFSVLIPFASKVRQERGQLVYKNVEWNHVGFTFA